MTERMRDYRMQTVDQLGQGRKGWDCLAGPTLDLQP